MRHAVLLTAIACAACTSRDAPPIASSAQRPTTFLDRIPFAIADSAEPQYPLHAVMASDGTIYVATLALSRVVGRFDGTGRLLGTVGHLGSGPGEYRDVSRLFLKGDSLVVAARERRDLQLFAPDGRSVRALPMPDPGPHDLLLLRGDTVAFSGVNRSQTIADEPRPVRLVDSEGRVFASLGWDTSATGMSRSLVPIVSFARESDSTFWVAPPSRYVLELRSAAGKRLRRLEPQRTWFQPYEREPASFRTERPVAMLLRVHRDAHGHLIVLLRRARDDWQPTPRSPFEAPSEPIPTPSETMKAIEEVIEVLDPLTGTLLASMVQRDTAVFRFLNDTLVFGATEDLSGRVVPLLWRFRHP